MEAVRDYRYTVPGVAFAALILIAFFSEFRQLGDWAQGLGLLSGFLLSFAIGYPFAAFSGFLLEVIPHIGSLITIPPAPDQTTRKAIEDLFGSMSERKFRSCVSILHHSLLDPKSLQFLTRRLNLFYIDINTVIALWTAIVIIKAVGKNIECIVISGVLGITALLLAHGVVELLSHRRMCAFLYPLLIQKLICPMRDLR